MFSWGFFENVFSLIFKAIICLPIKFWSSPHISSTLPIPVGDSPSVWWYITWSCYNPLTSLISKVLPFACIRTLQLPFAICVPIRLVIWKHMTVAPPVPHAQICARCFKIFEDFQQRWWFQSIWRGSSSGRSWHAAAMFPPFPKYVLQSEPELAGWWEMPSCMGKPNSQLPRAQLSLLKLTSCAGRGMAAHIPHSWAPSISCVPTTHRLWLAPAPQRWEVEACIWFSTPPQEANKAEHRK